MAEEPDNTPADKMPIIDRILGFILLSDLSQAALTKIAFTIVGMALGFYGGTQYMSENYVALSDHVKLEMANDTCYKDLDRVTKSSEKCEIELKNCSGNWNALQLDYARYNGSKDINMLVNYTDCKKDREYIEKERKDCKTKYDACIGDKESCQKDLEEKKIDLTKCTAGSKAQIESEKLKASEEAQKKCNCKCEKPLEELDKKSKELQTCETNLSTCNSELKKLRPTPDPDANGL